MKLISFLNDPWLMRHNRYIFSLQCCREQGSNNPEWLNERYFPDTSEIACAPTWACSQATNQLAGETVLSCCHVYVNMKGIEIGPLQIFILFFWCLSCDSLIYLQHIFGHHPYTNIDGFDPDISTANHVSSWAWAINWLLNTYILTFILCIWTDVSCPRHSIFLKHNLQVS